MAMSSIPQIGTSFNPSFKPIMEEPRQAISVLSVEPGEGDLLGTVDIKIGGLILRQLKVRRGRGESIFLNLPSVKNKETGQRHVLYEITSPFLEEAARKEIL